MTTTTPRQCRQCPRIFTPARPHQQFCSKQCRQKFHSETDGSTIGTISRVSLLRSGDLSIVIRVPPIDRENALSLVRGGVVDLREVKGASDA